MSTLLNIVNVLGVITLGLSLFITSAILVVLILMTVGAIYNGRADDDDDCVKVVRCEHCQYSNSVEDPFSKKTVYYCDVLQHQVQADGFCSSGDKGVRL